MPKVKYGKSALKAAKTFKIDLDILEGEVSREQRKEIQRVFHAANRRIENIEKSGVYSPAYQSLKATFDDRQNLTKFSKFSLSGMTDAEIKTEYAKAISFLQKPTSTSNGAKSFEKNLQRELGLNDWEFKTAKDKLLNKRLDDAQKKFAENYLMRYNDTLKAFETAVNDVSQQIESDAKKITASIDNFENKVIQTAENTGEGLNDIMESFKRFGM